MSRAPYENRGGKIKENRIIYGVFVHIKKKTSTCQCVDVVC